ncbi:MAG: S8 family serine peptidase [Planctomycetes bacterium]|nr:S8 family serine peptidase [Planctomycetota bacterium]
MNWSRFLPWRWRRGMTASARRQPKSKTLTIETLEDRVVPSAFDTLYQSWRLQRFKVDDMAVANVVRPTAATQAAVPTNASFGSMIGLPSVFTNTTYRGEGYSVAVIDTGIDYNNPALGGGFGAGHRVVAGWDFVNNDADPMDDNGHGTHVAGIIGSSDATYSGIAPNVNLIALKVLDSAGSGSFGNVQAALDWIVANRAKYNIVALNLSLGSGNYTVNPYTFLDADFTNLKNNGVFLSVAAGNSFYTNGSAVGLDYPAIDPLVVSVGAVYDGNFGAVAWASGARDNTTAVDRVASFSQRGSALSIMAPVAMITSTYLHNAWQSMAGTSMASPVAAGAAVILHQAMDARSLTANQDSILALMKRTGVNVIDGDDENDNVTNTGMTFKRLDLGAAVAALGAPANSAPVLAPIASQKVAPGSSIQVTLSATDPNGDAITFSAAMLGSSSSQAYQLKTQLGLQFAGSYYTNTWSQNEKWLTSVSGNWYCILPNGELRHWAGDMTATLLPANLVATLETRFYTDPSLLWNAQPAAATPTVSVSGNQLTIQAPADASGDFQVQVTASDGKLSTTQTFTVSVKNNTAPVLNALAARSILTLRSTTVTLGASDAQNDPISYSVKIVGAFTTAPASLVLTGNQLTIHSAPDFVGGFDIQVSASDGSLAGTTTLHVDVAASAVVNRFSADFNGDGIKDTAFFNQDGSWWVSLNKSDGSYVNQNWVNWSAARNWALVQVGDVTGDGKADLIGFYNDGAWYVGRSTGAAFTNLYWTQWHAASNWRYFQIGDFNGDGKTDIVGMYNNGEWYVGYSTGAACNVAYYADWNSAQGWNYLGVGDFNGDGKTDIIGLNSRGGVWVGASTGAPTYPKLWTQWNASTSWSSFSIGDVNNDGKLDFFAQDADGKWFVAYSTGSSFSTQLWTSASPPSDKSTK